MRNLHRLGFPVLLAAALIQTTSGKSWTDVLAAVLLSWGLLQLPRPRQKPGWLCSLQEMWSAFIIGQILVWFDQCWPQFPIWAAAGMLGLALWQTGKEEKATAAAVSVLGRFELALIGGVLLAGIKDMQITSLADETANPDGWLLTVLLIPALLPQKENRSISTGLWALGISLITGAVVPQSTIPVGSNAFREMSKSISLFGKIWRLESLTAAGLSLGFFLLICCLLEKGGGEAKKNRFLPALAGFALLLARIRIPGNYAAIFGVFVWIFLPAAAAFFEGKGKKKDAF